MSGPVEPYRPSNGSEGEIFMDDFCYRCARLDGCDLLARAMVFPAEDPAFPAEWIRDAADPTGYPGASARCTAFEAKP